jgi:Arc/MetJ family transcription regulator
MDLIERPEIPRRQLALQNPLSMLRNVPVQVPRRSSGKRPSESSLPHLPRPSHENHLPRQIALHLPGQVPMIQGSHSKMLPVFSPTVKKSRECFGVRVKKVAICGLNPLKDAASLRFPERHLMRITIEIEDKLMHDALRATGLKTQREAVEFGLRTVLRLHQQAAIRSFRGKLTWQGDLDALPVDE